MTPDELYVAYAATCDVFLRTLCANIPLPASIEPAPWMKITDTQLFTSTQLTRLEGAPIVADRAGKSLEALLRFL